METKPTYTRIIVRSYTGKYHMSRGVITEDGTVRALVNGSTFCSLDGRRSSIDVRMATEQDPDMIPAEAKCKKCFR